MYGQPNPMMMQAQMGSMGMVGGMGGMGGIGMLGNLGPNSGMFFYAGNAIGLESRIEDALNQNMNVTDVSITVTGNQVKQQNIGCYVATIVLASIFIIPMFFLCCGWWKRMVSPAYSVPMSTYQKLSNLLYNPSIKSVTLTVCDSTFDKGKAMFLYDMLSRSSIKGFTFTNIATPNDYDSNEWSDFKDHMKPIKSLPIMSEIKWYDQVVLY